MGNYASKLFSQNIEDVNINNTQASNQVNSLKVYDSFTPVTTRKKFIVDVRSATAEISRTPIEVNYTPLKTSKKAISAIPKHLQVRLCLENNSNTTAQCSADNCTDPRSPTINLQRTPISVTNISSYPAYINKLENQSGQLTPVSSGLYKYSTLDPRSPSLDFDRTPILIPKPDRNEKMESQHDPNAQMEKCDTTQSKFHFCETVSFNTLEIQALINETINEITYSDTDNTSYSSTVDESKLHRDKDTDHDAQDSRQKNVQNETTAKENNFKVWRDSTSECVKNSDINEFKFSQIIEEENETAKIKDVPICNNKNIQDTLENKKIKTNASNGTNSKNFISHNSNVHDNLKKRTPLRNRCNNSQFDTVLTKSPQHVLQSKSLSMATQQENTPPHKKYDSKSKVKGTQWDFNSSVVI